jgi:hypothetical protein
LKIDRVPRLVSVLGERALGTNPLQGAAQAEPPDRVDASRKLAEYAAATRHKIERTYGEPHRERG